MKKTQKFLIVLCLVHASIVFSSSNNKESENIDIELLVNLLTGRLVRPFPLDVEILLEFVRKKETYEENLRLDLIRTVEAMKQPQKKLSDNNKNK